ncbi:hypothetical protein NOR_08602 [Metarhizium rileyi]|uniref:Uncharacterized protein n=1 Tax=Metarhizium rileyi (strain RCEF 4871) TaxID=1649241 RepID=A0A166VZQ3_METRR|nr:hypothetical protein NOR_08602 [Metarhizium rileyi RCEF 4871]
MDESESRSSNSNSEESPPWQSNLLHCLGSIQTIGDFSWSSSYHLFVNPGLVIDGCGQVSLPVCPRVAQQIKQACRLAPFGNGHQTVVDDSVRKTWELDNTQFQLENPHWQAFLDNDILVPASQRLGLVGAQVKPHKLLLYEAGSFFKQHKDSQKEAGMVGTLVVCLPSEHDGGEVYLSFREKSRTHATGPGSRFDMTALAWFGDVSHEVKELKSGYRLVLTYNIIVPTENSPRSASFFDTQLEKLQHILIDWRETDKQKYRIYCPLEHKYSESSLSLGSLKGRDDAVCRVLHLAASTAGFSVFLASMTHHKERGLDEDDDECEEWTSLDNLYTFQGQLIARELVVHTNEILCSKLSYDDDMAADSDDESEYLGNEHSPAHLRYHDTVVVIWAKTKLDSLLGLKAGDLLVDALISEVVQDLKNRQDDKETVAYTTHFMKACCESKKHRPKSTLPQILDWGLALGDGALYEAAVKAGHDQPKVQKTLARHIEKDFSKRAELGDSEDEQWNKWLGVVVKNVQSLTLLQSSLHGFASRIGNCLEPSFQSWKEVTLMTQFKTKPQLQEADHDFILDLMEDHHDNMDWLSTRLLPELCSRSTKSLLFRVLDTVFRERDDTFTLDEARAIYKYILENSINACSLLVSEFGSYTSSEPRAFISLIDHGFHLGLADTLCHILEESHRRLQVGKLPDEARPRIAEFLCDLVKVLQKHDQLETLSTSVLTAFFETTLTKYFHHTVPSIPEERFKGWVTPARGCGELSCSACKELDDFLLSEDRQAIRFPSNQIWHIQDRLKEDVFIKSDTEYEEPGVQVLVVKKVQTVFQRDRAFYEWQIKNLERLVEPLKGEYLEKLLGNDMYRKLVLLEGLQPNTDMIRKRPAEERFGDDGKRAKTSREPEEDT